MLFWSCVDFTSDRRLLNVLWTDWICLGTRLEQAFVETENAFKEADAEDCRPCGTTAALVITTIS